MTERNIAADWHKHSYVDLADKRLKQREAAARYTSLRCLESGSDED